VTAWLRLYTGYAPGVGKTYAMLNEGRDVRRRGSDVVIGWVETYDRPHTLEAIGDLEVVPLRSITYRGTHVKEMDVEAVINRRPQVALVDELAHTNARGAKNRKRYQDVLELQASGIDVISTFNILHLAGLQHTIQLLAGVTVTETLPDWVLDAADEVEMIDQSPEALRKRVRRGNVQPRDQIERALDGFFRLDNLAALRELTLRRLADHYEHRRKTYSRGLSTPRTKLYSCVSRQTTWPNYSSDVASIWPNDWPPSWSCCILRSRVTHAAIMRR